MFTGADPPIEDAEDEEVESTKDGDVEDESVEGAKDKNESTSKQDSKESKKDDTKGKDKEDKDGSKEKDSKPKQKMKKIKVMKRVRLVCVDYMKAVSSPDDITSEEIGKGSSCRCFPTYIDKLALRLCCLLVLVK